MWLKGKKRKSRKRSTEDITVIDSDINSGHHRNDSFDVFDSFDENGEEWTRKVNFNVLNLSLSDHELPNNDGSYIAYSRPVRGASYDQLTTSALRDVSFHLESVSSSVRERDDGGPLADFARAMHARLLASTEQTCRHRMYLNRLRCGRVGLYLEVRSLLNRLLPSLSLFNGALEVF